MRYALVALALSFPAASCRDRDPVREPETTTSDASSKQARPATGFWCWTRNSDPRQGYCARDRRDCIFHGDEFRKEYGDRDVSLCAFVDRSACHDVRDRLHGDTFEHCYPTFGECERRSRGYRGDPDRELLGPCERRE